MRPLLLCLLVVLALAPCPPAEAAEPFFKKGDVIALVGGEDMVVASEYGYLELLLTRALPDYHLRFRNLAWEGDTVFEQRRDLNFPSYEEQLDKIGATVVIAQFGQMESFEGLKREWSVGPLKQRSSNPFDLDDAPIINAREQAVADFIAAYEKLIDRFSDGGKRRVVLATTQYSEDVSSTIQIPRNNNGSTPVGMFNVAVVALGKRRGLKVADFIGDYGMLRQHSPWYSWQTTRDGIHADQIGQEIAAMVIAQTLGLTLYDREKLKQNVEKPAGWLDAIHAQFHSADVEPLRQLIIAKNRLWFDYWRPQNWAFLAGDRTAQPSSRDHLDPSKRWFPPEREAFLPLLDAKEKEIDALAAQLAAGNAGK